MIPALVALVSAMGLGVAWRLLRPLPLRARDVGLTVLEYDEYDRVADFGYDWRGLVD